MNNAKHNVVCFIFLLLLLITSLCTVMFPTAQAKETSAQGKTSDILSEVAGFNTAAYEAVGTDQIVASQTDANFYLKSDESLVRVRSNFVNGDLHLLYLSDYEGVPFLKQPSVNTVDSARGFLERYQNYSGDSFYGELSAFLNAVDEKVNVSKTVENISFEARTYGSEVDYTWTYVDEFGVEAGAKNVVLGYSENKLTCFLNNWPLYTVVGSPKVSSEKAIEIAFKALGGYSYNATIDNVTSVVKDFTVDLTSLNGKALSYLNYANVSRARGGDSYFLYPMWYIPLGFDKVYPGGVVGLSVAIWADTGEISGINPMIADNTTSDIISEPVVTVTQNELILPISVTAAVTIVALAFASCLKKLYFARGNGLLCLTKAKIKKILFVGTAIFMLTIMAVPQVNAGYPNSFTNKSEIYACLDGEGFYNATANDLEKSAGINISSTMNGFFQMAGYASANKRGSFGTYVDEILSDSTYDESNFDRTALFHFGHTSYPVGRAYQDNDADPVTDTDVYATTSAGKHFFVLIWVCASASNPIDNGQVTMFNEQSNPQDLGTPIGWTHRDNTAGHQYMSANGYDPATADDYYQCYIGFTFLSPMISNLNTPTFSTSTVSECRNFIEYFYNYSVLQGYTVHDAINQASLDYFNLQYLSCPLNQGFNAWFPNTNSYHPTTSYMKVFGNSRITLTNAVTFGSNLGGTPVTFRLNGNAWSTGVQGIAFDKIYTVDVDAVSGYTLNYVRYTPTVGSSVDFNTPYNLTFNYPGSLTAYFVPNVVYRYLDVWSATGGYTNYAVGSHPFVQGQTAYVTAYENGGYTFDYWIVDGQNVGSSNPIGVSMNIDHYIQPVFYANPPPQYSLSISSGGGGSTSPSPGTYWYNQGTGVQVSANAYGGYQFDHWVLDGNSYGQNPISVTMNSNHNLQAVFSALPTYSLTVTASDAYGSGLDPPVYIDGGYVGLAGNSFQVTAGSHTVAVHSPFVYWTFDHFSDGLGNGATRQITGNTNLHAWYTV